MSVEVAVYSVAHTELLVHPALVGSIGIVVYLNLLAGGIDEVLAAIEVYNLVAVCTLVGTEVDTAIEVDVRSDLGVVCRHQAVPVVVV